MEAALRSENGKLFLADSLGGQPEAYAWPAIRGTGTASLGEREAIVGEGL